MRRARHVRDDTTRPDRRDRRVQQGFLEWAEFFDVFRRTAPAGLRTAPERTETAARYVGQHAVERTRRPGRLGAVADEHLVVAGDCPQVLPDEFCAVL